MSKTDLGKSWETVFRRSWEKQFPGTFIHRLPDQMSGYRETSADGLRRGGPARGCL